MDQFDIPSTGAQPAKKPVGKIVGYIGIAVASLLIGFFAHAILFSNDSEISNMQSSIGSKSKRILQLERENIDLHNEIQNLREIADERGDRVDELEDIIERAQRAMSDVVFDINIGNDSWVITNDINDVIYVLNEY